MKRFIGRGIDLVLGFSRPRSAIARALLAQADPFDWELLRRVLERGISVDLDAPPTGDYSILWSMLWEGSRLRRFGNAAFVPVDFHFQNAGFRMEIDLAETPECGYVVRDPTPHLTRLIRPGGRGFLDIGANAGFHSLCAARTFDAVHAFEPTPSTAARLRRNVESSGLADRVRVHEVALSDRRGRAGLSIDPRHCGANRIKEGAGLVVAAETLDHLDAEGVFGGVDLIKIDVEGHQDAVVQGARAMLGRHRPRLFVELGSASALRSFRRLLPDGYRVTIPSNTADPRPLLKESEAARHRDLLFEPES